MQNVVLAYNLKINSGCVWSVTNICQCLPYQNLVVLTRFG
uniref:Uncharacterized protein n=1 Tax=Arundo donax TaxID=35708 RepID=A0A0A9HJX0_ARUDO